VCAPGEQAWRELDAPIDAAGPAHAAVTPASAARTTNLDQRT
jgi:hypothetical protein